SVVEGALRFVAFGFGREREAQEVAPARGRAPLRDRHEMSRRDMPRGFLHGFAARGVGEAFAGLEVAGGLVQHAAVADHFLDQQEAPVARHDRGDGDVRAPDSAAPGGGCSNRIHPRRSLQGNGRPDMVARERIARPDRRGFVRGGAILGYGPSSEANMTGTTRRETGPDHGVAVEESRPEVDRPPLYRVILINDDLSPTEFVVVVLETFFSMIR